MARNADTGPAKPPVTTGSPSFAAPPSVKMWSSESSRRTARRSFGISRYDNGMAARRIAIVTGGNRGIGHEIARQLIGNDVHVVIGCRDRSKCEHAVAALKMEGPNVSGFTLDVVDTRSVRRFVDHVLKEHGAPSILVNNAGVYPEATDARVVDTPTSIWRETIETNL